MSAPRKALVPVREYRLRGMTRSELRAEARLLGLHVPRGSSTAELRRAIVRELHWRRHVEAA